MVADNMQIDIVNKSAKCSKIQLSLQTAFISLCRRNCPKKNINNYIRNSNNWHNETLGKSLHIFWLGTSSILYSYILPLFITFHAHIFCASSNIFKAFSLISLPIAKWAFFRRKINLDILRILCFSF